MRRKKWVPKKIHAGQPPVEQQSPWDGSCFHATFELEDIDPNSKIGRSMVALKTYLRGYVVQGNILSELLIGRITYKVLKLMMYETHCLQKPADVEAPHYLPMANSLRLDLRSLADLAGETKPPDLSDYLKLKSAKEVKNESSKMKRQK